jgi:serine/threonine protein kinase
MVMEYCEGGDLFKTMLMHGGMLEEQWVCVEVRGLWAGWFVQGAGAAASQPLFRQALQRYGGSYHGCAAAYPGLCQTLLHPACLLLTLLHSAVAPHSHLCTVKVIAPLLRILEKMHTLKLLHRDIKPENIFLTALGKFKLVREQRLYVPAQT